ncbi:MAG: hypothetical protein CME62_17260 [Halobacteriovoraceae bacterium]|nr:hypothetical protein [Halobacteriovoraceae bacterium]
MANLLLVFCLYFLLSTLLALFFVKPSRYVKKNLIKFTYCFKLSKLLTYSLLILLAVVVTEKFNTSIYLSKIGLMVSVIGLSILLVITEVKNAQR